MLSLIFASLLNCSAPLPAPCLWDRDTLAQENARFPGALELITGKFPRHSKAYYEWRVKTGREALQSGDRTPGMFDDLAVAHSKLGNDERAIELMGEKAVLFPGLYETAANLGTFLIHAGRLEQGAGYIEEAIEINPDAHFGREVTQLDVVRYVLQQRSREGAAALPLEPKNASLHGLAPGSRGAGFWKYLYVEKELTPETAQKELSAAIQGVLGMLRFGNHDSPVLLEVLSDLLLVGHEADAKNLAARALLQAAARVEDETARESYRAKARFALSMQTPASGEPRSVTLEEIEREFAKELEQAGSWWEKLERNEAAWIAADEDVDARFRETYYEQGTVEVELPWRMSWRSKVLLGLGGALLILFGLQLRKLRPSRTLAEA